MNQAYEHQQGDVQLFRVDEIPEDAQEREGHDGILAEGEATGHHHRMMGPVCLFDAPNGDVFMDVPKRIELRHQEHGAQTVDSGKYRIGRIREYDYVEQEARVVAD